MTIANSKKTRLSPMDLQLGSGSLTPDTPILDGLLITQDSVMNLDQLETNTQDDIMSGSLGNLESVVGSKGGSFSANGNLASFGSQVTKEPAIGKYLEACRMAKTSVSSMLMLATPANVEYGTIIENTAPDAEGIVRGVDPLNKVIYYEPVLGVFADTDVVTVKTGGDAVGDIGVYALLAGTIYKPDSNSNVVASGYQYKDGTRKALSDCVGSFDFAAESGKFVKFTMPFMGKYDDDNWEDASTPPITYADFGPSVFRNSQLKLTFGIAAPFVPVNTNLSFNLGNSTFLRKNSVDLSGLVGADVSSRSAAAANVVIEDEDESIFPYIKHMLSCDNKGIIDYNFSDCNNRPNIFVHQNVSIESATDGDNEGIATAELQLKVIDPNLDDGDCTIMFV